MRAAVVRALLKELNTLDLEFPEVSKSERAAFAEARKQLESE